MGQEVKTAIVTTRHHLWNSTVVSYNVGEKNTLDGLSFAMLGIETGDKDRFEVTVKRLPRLSRGPRFPKNPWEEKRKRIARRMARRKQKPTL